MKPYLVRPQRPIAGPHISDRPTGQQADEPIGNADLHQPTDVEVFLDHSFDIEAFERAEWEKQQQALL